MPVPAPIGADDLLPRGWTPGLARGGSCSQRSGLGKALVGRAAFDDVKAKP